MRTTSFVGWPDVTLLANCCIREPAADRGWMTGYAEVMPVNPTIPLVIPADPIRAIISGLPTIWE